MKISSKTLLFLLIVVIHTTLIGMETDWSFVASRRSHSRTDSRPLIFLSADNGFMISVYRDAFEKITQINTAKTTKRKNGINLISLRVSASALIKIMELYPYLVTGNPRDMPTSRRLTRRLEWCNMVYLKEILCAAQVLNLSELEKTIVPFMARDLNSCGGLYHFDSRIPRFWEGISEKNYWEIVMHDPMVRSFYWEMKKRKERKALDAITTLIKDMTPSNPADDEDFYCELPTEPGQPSIPARSLATPNARPASNQKVPHSQCLYCAFGEYLPKIDPQSTRPYSSIFDQRSTVEEKHGENFFCELPTEKDQPPVPSSFLKKVSTFVSSKRKSRIMKMLLSTEP